MKFELTADELNGILEYAVHRPTCDTVADRRNPNAGCTCGLVRACRPISVEQRRHARTGAMAPGEYVVCNANLFNGRALPNWLLTLIEPRRYVGYDRMNVPGPMSDG